LQHTTAILVFARTARAEQLHKKWYAPAKQVLHSFLYQQTIDTVKDSGIPYYVIDETQQVGHSFGERFGNALQQVFDRGYSQVIAVGSDCPQRTTQDLLKSRELVEQNRVCLCPDTRGGVHLIAISKQIFESGILNAISWNTRFVLEQLTRLLSQSAVPHQTFATYADINDFADIFRLLNHQHTTLSLQYILRRMLFRFIKQLPFHISPFLPSSFAQQHLFRGPPSPFII
jgi:2-phospho-L-lactate guanylyltransferase (CobY/MobA/RfbA family)